MNLLGSEHVVGIKMHLKKGQDVTETTMTYLRQHDDTAGHLLTLFMPVCLKYLLGHLISSEAQRLKAVALPLAVQSGGSLLQFVKHWPKAHVPNHIFCSVKTFIKKHASHTAHASIRFPSYVKPRTRPDHSCLFTSQCMMPR